MARKAKYPELNLIRGQKNSMYLKFRRLVREFGQDKSNEKTFHINGF